MTIRWMGMLHAWQLRPRYTIKQDAPFGMREWNCMACQCWLIAQFRLMFYNQADFYRFQEIYLEFGNSVKLCFSLFLSVPVNQQHFLWLRYLLSKSRLYDWLTRFVKTENRLHGTCIPAIAAFFFVWTLCMHAAKLEISESTQRCFEVQIIFALATYVRYMQYLSIRDYTHLGIFHSRNYMIGY